MHIDEVFAYLAVNRLAIVCSVHATGAPSAALVGFAVTPDRQLVFDTSAKSRKAANLRARPQVALVVGWDEETTVQIEGFAFEPRGEAAERAREAYFKVWPDGRERLSWPDMTHFAVQPTWLRYSRYTGTPTIQEYNLAEVQ